MLKLNKLVQFAVTVTLVMGWASGANAVPIVYQGYDAGANSLAAAPNAQAASNNFDAAAGSLNIIDFDTNTTGATLSPSSSPQGCGFALCGGNTTAGGSNFFGHVFTTTIVFDTAIDAFGAYFSGWQRSIQTIQYTDGSAVTLNMPAGNLNSGGLVFFGFIDIGASIASITYDTFRGDFVGIDDMRFGTVSPVSVSEPSTLVLLSLGLLGVLFSQSRKKQIL